MNPIKNLLLAVGFSEHSNITLRSAIQYCKESGSTLSLIHVVPIEGQNQKDHMKIYEQQISDVANNVKKQNVEVPHTKVVVGEIEEQVMKFAELIKVNGILIGSGNYHHNKKHRLGGNAEAILRNSSVPVLIIKDILHPLKGKIACPIDISPASEIILKTAIDYASHVGGELVIVHALEPSPYGYRVTDFDFVYAEKNFYNELAVPLEGFLKKIDFKGVPNSVKILIGQASHEVPEYIKKHPFSMTILGSSSRKGLSRLILGSVAETVIRNTDSPCLVIKPD
jgi:universal stress protein A